jgi:acyl transferase domain-containing protein
VSVLPFLLEGSDCYCSANGFAGTVAGVVLEDPKKPMIHSADLLSAYGTEALEEFPMLFVVSAKSAEALRQYLWKYLDFCRTAPTSNFRSICYTTCLGREHYRYRFACVVSNMGNLIKVLKDRIDSMSSRASSSPAACRIAFAFPGQGSHYQAMASDLIARYPGFKVILDSAASAASMLSGYPISSFLADAETSCDLTIDNSQVAQICIFVYQYSICTWLKQLGIEPQAVLGHSLGEIAAAGAYDIVFHFGYKIYLKVEQ